MTTITISRAVLRPPRRSPGARARAGAAATLILLLAAAGCASLGGTRPEEREVVVRLSVSRATAVRRTLAAMREQGYRVPESLTSGGELTTEPFPHGGEAEATFVAVVTGSASDSRVTLTGTYRRKQFGGIVKMDPQPIRRDAEGVEGELWARMQNLALAIRAMR